MRYRIAAGIAAFGAVVAGLIFLFKRKKLRSPNHELYVASPTQGILGFRINSNGRVESTPWRVIADPIASPQNNLQNPFDVKLDASNRIWVLNLGQWPGMPANQPSIRVFDQDADGDPQPLLIIPQPGVTGDFTLVRPGAIFMRQIPPNLVVADQVLFPGGFVGLVKEFPIDFTGGFLLGLLGVDHPPTGVAVDAIGRYYVSQPTHNAISIFVHRIGENFPVLIDTIQGDQTALASPAHIAIDPRGFIVVANLGSRQVSSQDACVTVYSFGSGGNALPARIIGGHGATNPSLIEPYGIAVDQDGRIFVSDSNRILVFGPNADGNVSPDQTITLNYPVGLCVR